MAVSSVRSDARNEATPPQPEASSFGALQRSSPDLTPRFAHNVNVVEGENAFSKPLSSVRCCLICFAALRTSSLYAANPYCCRDRRSLASCGGGGPIPVPMPLLPACATLPRDRRPLSLSPAEFAGQIPPDFSSLRPLNLMNQPDVRSLKQDAAVRSPMCTCPRVIKVAIDVCARPPGGSSSAETESLPSLDLCGGQGPIPGAVVAYKDPDLVSNGPHRACSATPGPDVQDCSISQSSSTAPLLASPDLLVDQNDHPSAYFR
ncbi:leucine-rich repeat-containing protein 4B-like [Tropilaelaps mercedesae]|uniref:Leucine-rich repeat-containing protein 4B-like n=1 Tax=Tropilaelaps mercedesae TaxID=418985 RepID=A0A1V9WZR8_9ACAR|nr:leucine-rich repeat-containing protein 4B-like [Tropilaelaps mercedesae]